MQGQSVRGRKLSLSIPRRFVADLMRFSHATPGIPVQRRLDLSGLCSAQRAASEPAAWSAIFTRAFALVAAEFPQLRRVYLPYPRPHLFEYPVSVANIAVERTLAGEPAVLPLLVKNPAALPLAELTRQLRYAARAPLEEISSFRRVLRVSGLPRPLRRAAWWLGLNLARPRGNYFGTFGVTAVPALGASILHPRAPLTVLLTYSPLDASGHIDVRAIFDHRVLDAATMARALQRLEDILNVEIRAELAAGAPGIAA